MKETCVLKLTSLPFRVGATAFLATASLLAAAVTAAPGGASAHVFTPAIGAQARYVQVGAAAPDRTFSCQNATYPIHCYAPQQIRNAYDITPLLNKGITGTGRTIVIIDAYQSPTIRTDLALFDRVFGLPNPTLNIIAPDGLTPFDQTDPNQVGWAGEISLDVQWAHAVAPGATIDLVLAKSNQDADLLSVTKYAVDNNLGDVISQSFGEGESCADPAILAQEHQVFEEATNKGMTIFASAGDSGAAQPTCDNSAYFLSASTPASDPLVTGVGGTTLNADLTTGAYGSESVWNDDYGSGGGGYSTVYKRPDFQAPVVKDSHMRGVPDVSYNAGVNGGVLAVWSSNPVLPGTPLIFIFGGTSAGSPQWAGITALADQEAGGRVGFLNKTLYHIGNHKDYSAVFHDVTAGNNSVAGITGYSAVSGWDAASGWGSPDVANLVPLLVSDNQGRDSSADTGAVDSGAPTGHHNGSKSTH